MDWKMPSHHQAPTTLDTLENFERAVAMAIKLAHDDYMSGLVRVTPDGTRPDKKRARSAIDVLTYIGVKRWMKCQEQPIMAAYRATLTMLDGIA